MSAQWKMSQKPVAYEEALREMEARVEDIRRKGAPDMVWLLEHPPLYTAGTSARPEDLLQPRFPVFETGRGGQYTYHGPGQRVGYVMMDLKKRQSAPDIKEYIRQLEEWIICTLEVFGIQGERRDGRVGIWVVKPGGAEAKIAAIGVRVRHWVTYHGFSINLNPDLSHFDGIVPCGIRAHGVTSFEDLGVKARMDELDGALQENFDKVFS
ncbi:MAG: lipoyl(octanoyl) transferase LipB [Rhodospirillales bacterium]|nr:lipoyl(octanoyl) transferase LipB [Alphaproteobacteria bacterium]USO03564.1 MAG: lipoyl(octanoyl) transferase LipB [Rhodospirillales bacterium]